MAGLRSSPHDVGVLFAASALLASCGRLGFETTEPESATDASVEEPPVVEGGLLEAAAPAVDGSSGPTAPDARVTPSADAAVGPPPSTDAGAVDATTDGRPEPGPPDASVADAAPDARVTPGDVCESVASLAAPPMIDGLLEPGLTLRRVTPVGWTGAAPIPATHDAVYAVGWRPDGVYLFVAVTDDTPEPAATTDPVYCGDGVELYVDGDGAFPASPSYDVPGTMQFIVSAPENAVDPFRRGERWNNVTQLQGDMSGTQFVARPTTTGYTVEALITGPDLGDTAPLTLAAGGSVGLALAINLAEPGIDAGSPCPGRLGQYFSRIELASTGCRPEPFCTTEAFCVAPLLP